MFPELTEIARRRRALGWTQEELERGSGVPQSEITKIERGRVRPSYHKVISLFRALEKEEAQREGNLLAGDVMTAPVISLAANTKVLDARQLMLKRGISQVPVVDKGRIVGSVSEAAFLRILESDALLNRARGLLLSDVIEPELPLVPRDTPLKALGPLLDSHAAVLVIEKGDTVGIVSRADIMRALR